MQNDVEVVYFIAAKGRIKVGTSKDLRSRMNAIRTSNPDAVSLLGAVTGGRKLERAIHSELAIFAIGGEWFESRPAALHIVEQYLALGVTGPGAIEMTEEKSSQRLSASTNEARLVEAASARLAQLIGEERLLGADTPAALIAVGANLGLSFGAVWGLRYRRPKAITAGTYLAIMGDAGPGNAAVASASALVGATDNTNDGSGR